MADCAVVQDIGWFDVSRTGELTTSIERDCANVQAAVGEKIAIFVQNMTTFVGNFPFLRMCALCIALH
jgi:hypothetical protein